MANLYVNGCSNSCGTPESLGENFPEKTWGKHLSILLHCDEFNNDSVAGGSNERILRTTTKKFSELEILPDIVVIQFTTPERFETPDLTEKMFININPNTYTSITNLKEIDVGFDKTIKKFCDRYRNTYIHHQKLLLEEKALTEIILLQSLLDNLAIPYVFLFWPSMLAETMQSKLYKSIDKSNVANAFGGTHYSVHHILQSYGFELCQKINSIGAKDNHYMEDAQEFLAGKVYEFIKYRTPIVPKGLNTNIEYQEVTNHYG